jgi:hypothetical protein
MTLIVINTIRARKIMTQREQILQEHIQSNLNAGAPFFALQNLRENRTEMQEIVATAIRRSGGERGSEERARIEINRELNRRLEAMEANEHRANREVARTNPNQAIANELHRLERWFGYSAPTQLIEQLNRATRATNDQGANQRGFENALDILKDDFRNGWNQRLMVEAQTQIIAPALVGAVGVNRLELTRILESNPAIVEQLIPAVVRLDRERGQNPPISEQFLRENPNSRINLMADIVREAALASQRPTDFFNAPDMQGLRGALEQRAVQIATREVTLTTLPSERIGRVSGHGHGSASLDGLYSSRENRVYISEGLMDRSSRMTVIVHELGHRIASPNRNGSVLGDAVEEGINEILSIASMRRRGQRVAMDAYENEVAAMSRIFRESHVSLALVAACRIDNNYEPIKTLIDARYGTGTWDQLNRIQWNNGVEMLRAIQGR